MKVYHFEIEGAAADEQTWKTSGDITDTNNAIMDVFDTMMRMSFEQLTKGKAVFGKPGAGCRGPYDITRVTLQRIHVKGLDT